MTKSLICMMRITEQFLYDLKPHFTLCLPFSHYEMLEAENYFFYFLLLDLFSAQGQHPFPQPNTDLCMAGTALAWCLIFHC